MSVDILIVKGYWRFPGAAARAYAMYFLSPILLLVGAGLSETLTVFLCVAGITVGVFFAAISFLLRPCWFTGFLSLYGLILWGLPGFLDRWQWM